MSDNTNSLNITGTILSIELAYENKKFNEKFYQAVLEVPRWSNNSDELPVIISEKLLFGKELAEGDIIMVDGQIRTRNYTDESGRNHLSIFGYANEIEKIDLKEYAEINDKNVVMLDGFLCKNPVNRKTSRTGRIITDLLVAVNRKYNRSDYIPAIAWGRNAQMLAEYHVGDAVSLIGRFQSRTYYKKGSDQKQVAYEVSVVSVNTEEDEKETVAEEAVAE